MSPCTDSLCTRSERWHTSRQPPVPRQGVFDLVAQEWIVKDPDVCVHGYMDWLDSPACTDAADEETA